MNDTIKHDDYARLHFAYHEDTDLAMIADTLDDEHEAGYLVWLYWPRMVARAKQAKTFGWFSATPRKLAMSLHDTIAGDAWAARARMWDLLLAADLIRVRQDGVEGPSSKLDVLIVEWEKWQSLSDRERSKLRRERSRVDAGGAPHWTVRHWSDFAFSAIGGVDNDAALDSGHRPESRVTDRNSVTPRLESRDDDPDIASVTRHKTRQDEKVGRERPLPTTIIRTIESVRTIPGMSTFQLTSNVIKAMQQYPSLDDEAVCEAISAFEANVPEGATLRSGASWTKLRNCFAVARKRMDENAATVAAASFEPKRRTAAELLAEQDKIWGQSA